VDTHRDYIVDADVIADANENTDLVPMVDRVEKAFGQRPEAVLADGLNATGPENFSQRIITGLTKVEGCYWFVGPKVLRST
jgi:hypothetical protein